jgi:predicted permease
MATSFLAQDIRHTFRTLYRDGGFFAIAVLIIAIGIGANTAIFSVFNTLLFRPLPFHEPERLVWIANSAKGIGLSGVTSRSSNLRDYRRLNQSFESLTGYFAFFDYRSYTLTGDGEPERVVIVGVAQNFLDTLGIQPEMGRNFVDEECVWNGRPAVILTHGFWMKRYGGNPSIVGRTITINDEPTTVVGVLPASFDFSSTFTPGTRIDFLNPFPISDETDNWGNTLAMIGRLKPGVTIERAQAELDLINQQLQEADQGRWGLGAAVSGLHDQITGRFRRALVVLFSAVGVVLLIACTNLSNLLLARAASRRKEIAIRAALGAGRSRLIRQMLTESLVLSFCGAVLGVFIAYALTRLVAGTTAFSIPLLQAVTVDGTALLFTLVIALITGLLFGITPALQTSAKHEYRALNDSNRGSSEERSRTWIRKGLVVAEVALACVLLVGAGLLLKSFVTLMDVDLGFQPNMAAAWRIQSTYDYDEFDNKNSYFKRLVHEVENVPGVEAVGLTDTLPLGRNRSWGIRAKGEVYAEGKNPSAFPRMVDSEYIQTMRIPLLAGRNFTPHDTSDKENVMIVNEAMAQRLWPDRDPIDQYVLLGDTEWHVVGVVANVRHGSLEEEAGLEMYLPITQQRDWGSLELVVRTKKPPELIAADVRAALHAVDSGLPASDFQTLGQIVDRAVSPRRFILLLIGAFAATALVLASLGIYGVVSYSVTQRAQEIGIRMALGASASQVQRRIVVETLALTAVGILIGTAASLGLSRLMASLLYEVSPTDPLTFVSMMLLLTVIAALAGHLPARRASRIDPMSVLGSA